MNTARTPTVVLVHGAFADSSSWDGVIERLQRQGRGVVAAANPLRGLTADAAFAPDEGERLGDVTATSKDAILGTALVERHLPSGPDGEAGTEFAVDPAKFRAVFAADLPAERAAVLAVTQRPIAAAAFADPCGQPAWRTLPSWAVVATGDKAAGADLVRSMAERAGADSVEVEGSHLIMISQPQAVADVIVKAVDALGRAPGAGG